MIDKHFLADEIEDVGQSRRYITGASLKSESVVVQKRIDGEQRSTTEYIGVQWRSEV
jgi:hypothetical protein